MPHCAGPRHKGRAAAGPERALHVPGVSGDEAYLPHLDAKLSRRRAIRLGRRLEPTKDVGAELALKKFRQTSVGELRRFDLDRRISQCREPKPLRA